MKILKIMMGLVVIASLVSLNIACSGGGGGGTPSPFETPDPDPQPNPNDPGGVDPADPQIDPNGDDGGGNGVNPDDNGQVSDLDGDGIADAEDPDADGDGFLGSEDDCDDLNPDIYPGAPDRPDFPGYTDSNCDGVDGDIDFAFWVAPDGNDANPGTIDQPFRTIQMGITTAQVDLNDIRDVYVAEGIYIEDVVVNEGVGLYGGFGSLEADNTRKRSLDSHISQIIPVMSFTSIGTTTTGIETTLEGFVLLSLADTPALLIINSSPVIRHNKIYGLEGINISYAVFVWAIAANSESKPYIHDNLIESRDADKDNSLSVGLLIGAAGQNANASPLVYRNDIRSGNAGLGSIGVYLIPGEDANGSVDIIENTIEAEHASYISCGILMGYNIWEESPVHFTSARIDRNRIFGGSTSAIAAGIFMTNADQVVTVTNNFITGGDSSLFMSMGIGVGDTSAHIFNNSINAGSSDNDIFALMAQGTSPTKADNNIFYGESGQKIYGFFEVSNISTPASLRNNLFDDGLTVKYHDAVTGDILNVAAINILPDIAVISDNIAGNASFEDADCMDYHLMSDSDAIDAGFTLNEVEYDIDNESRTAEEFYDIGADEFVVE